MSRKEYFNKYYQIRRVNTAWDRYKANPETSEFVNIAHQLYKEFLKQGYSERDAKDLLYCAAKDGMIGTVRGSL